MRILYLCGDHGIPAFGRKGASTHLREMIAAFRGLGHEICLAAADLAGDRRPDEDFPVVKLPKPDSRLLGLDGRYMMANWRARSVLQRAVADFKPDAIYERSALYFTAGEWLAETTGLPRILEVNAFLAHEQGTRLHFPKLAERVEAGLLRHSRATAAISRHMEKMLIKLGCDGGTIRPFPMAVDPQRFHPVAEPKRRRQQLGWPDSDIVFGYVGSMNTYHRPNWFMDLAEKVLRRQEWPARFLVVGGSPGKVQRHRSRLLPWVNDGHVHFTGSIPQSDMAEWLASMDVVLIPGAAPQSTPTKIFEAAAVGCPLMLPATEPIQEICGKDAPYLFRPNDYRAFEEKVREFVATPSFFNGPAEKLHKRIITDYTWDGHARLLSAWFEEIRA